MFRRKPPCNYMAGFDLTNEFEDRREGDKSIIYVDENRHTNKQSNLSSFLEDSLF